MAPQMFAGKYEIQQEIARGGMGIIYKAVHRKLNSTVAIKLVHAHLSQDPSFAERFLREARAMARLRQHEHIVKIYDADEENGTHFLVMEYCPGRNLRTIIKSQAPLPERHVVQLAEQLASALAYAHAQGVIHRDIKPANVLVDDRHKAKLTDFGIAAARGEVALTSVDGVIGTAEYMSPEQARGLKLDGRSDLYSLGVVMYEMLTGKTPYGESSGTAILGKLAYDRAELDLSFPGPIHSMVKDVVRDLLRRDPDDRSSDADSLASQLREIWHVLPPAPTPPPSDDSAHTVIVTIPPPPEPPPPDTVIAPSPTALRKPESHDETIVQPQPPSASKSPVVNIEEELARAKQKRTPVSQTPPPSRPLGLIIAAGIILLGIIGIIMMPPKNDLPPDSSPIRPEQKDRSSDTPPTPDPSKVARHKEYKDLLAKLEPMVRDTAAQLDTTPPPSDCPTLKALLLETYEKYDHTVVEMNRVGKELGEESVTSFRPAALDRDCPVMKHHVPVPPSPPSPPSPPPKVVSPEKQLKSMIEMFTQAYEHRNLDQLRDLSRMSDARLVNLETMFHNYRTLKLSRPSISQEDSGAVVTFFIDMAVTTAGETVELSPIAKKITFRVPRQGNTWDKIVW